MILLNKSRPIFPEFDAGLYYSDHKPLMRLSLPIGVLHNIFNRCFIASVIGGV